MRFDLFLRKGNVHGNSLLRCYALVLWPVLSRLYGLFQNLCIRIGKIPFLAEPGLTGWWGPVFKALMILVHLGPITYTFTAITYTHSTLQDTGGLELRTENKKCTFYVFHRAEDFCLFYIIRVAMYPFTEPLVTAKFISLCFKKNIPSSGIFEKSHKS